MNKELSTIIVGSDFAPPPRRWKFYGLCSLGVAALVLTSVGVRALVAPKSNHTQKPAVVAIRSSTADSPQSIGQAQTNKTGAPASSQQSSAKAGSSTSTSTGQSTPSVSANPTAAQSLPSILFTASSPWNSSLPAVVNWVSNPALSATHWWVNDEAYSMPVVYSSNSYPLVAIQVPHTWGWPAQTLQLNVAAGVTGASGSDGSLVVISNNVAYNFWQFKRTDNTHATAAAYGEANIVSDSGWGSTNPPRGAGIRAVGASGLGGLIMGSDIAAGAINHALAVSLDFSLVSSRFVAPAIASDGSQGSIAEGTRLGIPAGTAMPAGLSSIGQMVWRSLAKYGAFVVDRGGGNALSADPKSVTAATVDPLRVYWGSKGHSDLDRIMPYVKLAQ
jgi:hypothetical protein